MPEVSSVSGVVGGGGRRSIDALLQSLKKFIVQYRCLRGPRGQPYWHRWPLRCPSQLCPGKGLGGWAHPIRRVVLLAAICTLNLLIMKTQFASHSALTKQARKNINW